MRVYGMKRSRSFRVVWALEEAGLDYDYQHVDLFKGEGRRPEYLSLNPNGKVPTLVHDGSVLWESGAICAFIGSHAADKRLVPLEPKSRAEYDRWCYFVIGELEQPLWTYGKHSFVFPEKHRVPAIIETSRWEFLRATKVLAQALGDREFILDQFSLADVMIGHTLLWSKLIKFPNDQENLIAYLERLSARPAFQRAMQKVTDSTA